MALSWASYDKGAIFFINPRAVPFVGRVPDRLYPDTIITPDDRFIIPYCISKILPTPKMVIHCLQISANKYH